MDRHGSDQSVRVKIKEVSQEVCLEEEKHSGGPHRSPGVSVYPGSLTDSQEDLFSHSPKQVLQMLLRAPEAHSQIGLASSVMGAKAALWGLRVQLQPPHWR